MPLTRRLFPAVCEGHNIEVIEFVKNNKFIIKTTITIIIILVLLPGKMVCNRRKITIIKL